MFFESQRHESSACLEAREEERFDGDFKSSEVLKVKK